MEGSAVVAVMSGIALEQQMSGFQLSYVDFYLSFMFNILKAKPSSIIRRVELALQ